MNYNIPIVSLMAVRESSILLGYFGAKGGSRKHNEDVAILPRDCE